METNDQSDGKNEIITLILADMRSRKLLLGLEATGLSTDIFNTNLSDLIFSKMKIARQHEAAIAKWYEDSVCSMLHTDLNTFKEHQLFLAINLYDALEERKNQVQADLLPKSEGACRFLKWIGLKGL